MYNNIDRIGVSNIETIVNSELNWIFREQPIADFGIDAHIEIHDGKYATGKLIALQIKAGPSYFNEISDNNIVFRGEDKHLSYWTQHSLPVIIVLFNPDTKECIWEHVSNEKIAKITNKWKLLIPRDKILNKNSKRSLEHLFESNVKIITVNSAPYVSTHFIGRDDKINEIKKNIDNNKSVVLVSGMGGIGKTEICKKLFHEFKVGSGIIKYIGWIVWNGSLKNSFIGRFYNTMSIENAEESFNETKKIITALSSELLLFIDNMNEISQEDEDIISELPCKFIISSRKSEIGNICVVPVDELSEDECIFIYKDILKRNSFEDENIRQIIRKAAYLTLVIELLAKVAKTANLSDKALLDKLILKGFNLSDIKKKIDKGKQFNENLLAIFDLSRISDKELLVLKQFSIFPSTPLGFEYAESWFEQDNPDILNNLTDKGWLKKTETGFYMHQVISGVIRYENAPGYDECARLVNSISNEMNFKRIKIFTHLLRILSFGEKIAEFFNGVEKDSIAMLMRGIAWIYENQYEYDKALYWLFKSQEILKNIYGIHDKNSYVTYLDIASIYRKQEKFEESLKYNFIVLKIFKNTLDEDNYLFSTVYSNISNVYAVQEKYDKALKYSDEAFKILNTFLNKVYIDMAMGFNNLASIYNRQHKYDDALEYYTKSYTMYVSVLGEHPFVAEPCFNIGILYCSKHKTNFAEGLKWFLKAYKIRYKTLPENHPDLNNSYEYLKNAYLSFNIPFYLAKKYNIDEVKKMLSEPTYIQKIHATGVYKELEVEFNKWLSEQLNSKEDKE